MGFHNCLAPNRTKPVGPVAGVEIKQARISLQDRAYLSRSNTQVIPALNLPVPLESEPRVRDFRKNPEYLTFRWQRILVVGAAGRNLDRESRRPKDFAQFVAIVDPIVTIGAETAKLHSEVGRPSPHDAKEVVEGSSVWGTENQLATRF